MPSSVKTAYSASAAFTITLASLATSSTLVTGRESTAISNSSALVLDYFVGGKITTGTSPTVGTYIELWAHAAVNDTPLYTDVLAGSDAAATFTSREILLASCRRLSAVVVTATSNVTYWFPPVSLRETFGFVPRNWGVFVTHSTAVNLNSTAGNHALYYTPMYNTVG